MQNSILETDDALARNMNMEPKCAAPSLFLEARPPVF